MAKFFGFIKGIPATLKRRWKLVGIIILLLGVGGFIFLRSQSTSQEKTVYVKPENRNLVKTLEVSGILDAEEKASLRFAAGGKVTYLGAKEGDLVKKGQTLATIDQRELQQRLQQDLNNYTSERLSWDQRLDDVKDKAGTDKDSRTTEQAQLELKNSVLNVEIRDTAIRQTRLSAPFGGILVSAPITTPGIQLLATDAFEVVNPETLIFKAAVDEADIAQVQIGQLADINLDAYPDEAIRSTIEYISPKSQQTSSATVFLVKLPLQSDPLLTKYRLGMNGDVTIILETKNNVLSIPVDTTRQRDGKTYVDVKEGEKNVEREIKTGLETDDYLEVLSGLTVQDEVVLPQSGSTK